MNVMKLSVFLSLSWSLMGQSIGKNFCSDPVWNGSLGCENILLVKHVLAVVI